MKYASVCSGVEAPSQAWESLGWEAQWFSEIEDFPSKVLAHHYPNVPNLGDMTKLTTNEVFNAADIQLLIGGTPCQSFSVAGLRKGLEDPRGNLALEFVRILSIKKPKWFIWENVPGVLSSGGGRDFASIIGAFTKIGYGVSWRVLDAQFFGVPQRRRRVFVVGYFGNWRPPHRVLFESEGLSGDFKKSREEREGFAGGPEIGAYFSKQAIGEYKPSNQSSTLAVRDSRGPEDLISQNKSNDGRIVGTLAASGAGLNRAAGQGNELDFCILDKAVSENQRTEVLLGDKCGALNRGGGKPGQGYPCVLRYSKSHRTTHTEQRVNDDGTTNTLSTGEGCGNQSSQNLVFTINGSDDCLASDKAYSLNTNSNATGRNVSKLFSYLGVRRLTPLECERLQGFKDNWTNIPGATNSKRYKACGNSMAVPVIRWLGERMQAIENEVKSSDIG